MVKIALDCKNIMTPHLLKWEQPEKVITGHRTLGRNNNHFYGVFNNGLDDFWQDC